ncbi:hypothetical protein HaLaN_14111, partial [Haematococcus lacustris]
MQGAGQGLQCSADHAAHWGEQPCVCHVHGNSTQTKTPFCSGPHLVFHRNEGSRLRAKVLSMSQ